jgi:hypothetical protein
MVGAETDITVAPEPSERADPLELQPPLAAFSPMYLLPFGGGQFAQDRPVFGGVYLGITLGLGAWFAIAFSQYADATANGQVERIPELGRLRVASGALLGAVVCATILEAVIYGLVVGE